MNKNLRRATIGAVASLIIAPILAMILIPNIEFAVLIMVEIAVIGFFTVIFVMIIGSEEDHYPTKAEDSAAVTAWSQREAKKQEQRAENSVENIEEASGAE